MKKIVVLTAFLFFMVSIFSGPVMGLDPATNPPRTERELSSPPAYTYVPAKSKEEIAFELFSRAMATVPELRLQLNYDQYLDAYKKALKAVYSGGP